MKLYKTTITPISTFASPLKGGTLLGQICWSILYIFGEERLKELINSYKKKPFLIVSDAFPLNYLPKPKMPSRLLGEDVKEKKKNRKKIWLKLEELKNGEYIKAKRDEEVNRDKSDIIIRNSLNYITSHTDDGFTPYSIEENSLSKKDLYFLLDEDKLKIDELKEALKLVSEMGYGKKTTIGKGRFKVEAFEEITIDNSSTTFMTLSPFSPQNLKCEKIFYEPITQFGKFGGARANKNPFKKPIILANTASVIKFKTKQRHQYLGKAIFNISTLHKDSIYQGYTIVIPIKEI